MGNGPEVADTESLGTAYADYGRELALELGIPEGTVRSRLYYALRALRLTLDEMGWEW